MKPKFRPDLTDYLVYVDLLADRLNEDSAYRMSKTDAVKMAIERAIKTLVPDVVINPKRKRYIEINF